MNDSQLILTIFAAMALGTPLIFATVGEIITERAGILNLGVQGTMLVGAVSGFWATFETGSLVLGVVVSMIAGAVFSMIPSRCRPRDSPASPSTIPATKLWHR